MAWSLLDPAVMKRVAGTVGATTLVLLWSTSALADWRLYVNLDNRGWSIEAAFPSSEECERAAQSRYRSGGVLGVTCVVHAGPDASPSPSAIPEHGSPDVVPGHPRPIDEGYRRSMGYTPEPPAVQGSSRVPDVPVLSVVPPTAEEPAPREAAAVPREAATIEEETRKRTALMMGALVGLTLVTMFAYGVLRRRASE